MLFDELNSTVIKTALMSKMQFSLGYKMIAAVIKSHRPPTLNFETGEIDDSPAIALKEAKKAFASFGEYCMTYGYQIDPIEAVIASYIKGTGKQPTNVPGSITALRAKVAGIAVDKLRLSAGQARERAIAKQEEELNKLKAEFMDLEIYHNGFYDTDRTDIEDIILDSWIIENYPKALKSQVAYWQRFNNWDDAELFVINEDQQTLETSKA